MRFNVSLKRVVDDSYDIEIGYGLYDSLVNDLKAGLVGNRKRLAVVTDDTVDRLYAAEMMRRLSEAGFKAEKFVIPSGEKSKTRQMKEFIEDSMLEKGFRRDCAVIAFGGGVVTECTAHLQHAFEWLSGLDISEVAADGFPAVPGRIRLMPPVPSACCT